MFSLFSPTVPGQIGILTWSASECASICSTDSSCVAYTYYEQGCYLKTSLSGGVASAGRISGQCKQQPSLQTSLGCSSVSCPDTSLFASAIETASQATHIILTLGLSQMEEYEGHDRAVIELPGFQYELAAALKGNMTAGQKMICVFVHGGE
jgi:hypothetical protein